jgi:hypothetical protein
LSHSFANERSVAIASFRKRAPYQWQAQAQVRKTGSQTWNDVEVEPVPSSGSPAWLLVLHQSLSIAGASNASGWSGISVKTRINGKLM